MDARPQPAGQGDKGIVVRRARLPLPPSRDHGVPEGREKQGHPLCQWKAPVGAFGVRPGWGKPPSHQAKAVLQSHTETPNPRRHSPSAEPSQSEDGEPCQTAWATHGSFQWPAGGGIPCVARAKDEEVSPKAWVTDPLVSWANSSHPATCKWVHPDRKKAVAVAPPPSQPPPSSAPSPACFRVTMAGLVHGSFRLWYPWQPVP